jgi:thiol-disulfide isomerase/thioredoxin
LATSIFWRIDDLKRSIASLPMTPGSFYLGLLLGAILAPVVLLVPLIWFARRKLAKFAAKPPWVPSDQPVSLAATVLNLDGSPTTLQALCTGRVAFVHFWGTWCAPCREEVAAINLLYRRLGDRVAFVCLSNERPATVRRFLNQRGLSFPAYIVKDLLPVELLPAGLPTTYLLSSAGIVLLRHVGVADWNDAGFVAYLEARLSDFVRSEATSRKR